MRINGYGLATDPLLEHDGPEFIQLRSGEGLVVRAEPRNSDMVAHVVVSQEVASAPFMQSYIIRIEPHVVVQNLTGIPLTLG